VTLRPLVNEPDIHAHTGFMLAEDEALKKYLTGIKVPGRDADSPPVNVGVWFRWPESERQIKYPFITIDSINAEPAYELFHSEHREPATYWPDKLATLPPPSLGWDAMNYGIRNFLPFKLTYQVNVYSRYNLHDRYLRSIFVTDVFPPRPFWVGVDADNSWRRTELMGYATNDQAETSESGTKRIFRKVWTVQMLAEVPQDRLEDYEFYRVFRVYVTGYDRDRLEQMFSIAHEGVEAPTPTP
jgi:hypothetical protein